MTFTAPQVIQKNRQPNYPLHPLIYSRWSPRALSDEALTQKELMQVFEAARWAPSSSNRQPWTFLYAQRETEYWPVYFSFLNEFNQLWAKRADVLIVVVAQTDFDGQKSAVAKFDTGAAWENLALEATHLGLIAHAMGGFDKQLATEKLNIPSTHQVMAMIALGKPGSVEELPKRMQKQEVPKQRQPLSSMIKEGKF